MFLGIEIGGTKLQLGVGKPGANELVQLERYRINKQHGADGILRQIKAHAPALVRAHQVKAIGIGFGGPVDTKNHRVITSHQVHGWNDRPLGDWCQQELGLPAFIDNDCNTAALAEARMGAGRGAKRCFYVTVGTGIGGGLVVNNQLYGNDRPGVAEIGHLRPGTQATAETDTVESIASGNGIEHYARELIRSDDKKYEPACFDLLDRCNHSSENLTGEMLAEATLEGNLIAEEAYARATETLGWAIAQTITLVAPEVVVVGGGVSLVGDSFFRPLEASIKKYVFPPLRDSYEIKTAKLGELVVVHGALMLCEGQVA